MLSFPRYDVNLVKTIVYFTCHLAKPPDVLVTINYFTDFVSNDCHDTFLIYPGAGA